MKVEDFLKKIARVTEHRGKYWAICLDRCLGRSNSENIILKNTLRMIINEEISSIAKVLLNEIQPIEEEDTK